MSTAKMMTSHDVDEDKWDPLKRGKHTCHSRSIQPSRSFLIKKCISLQDITITPEGPLSRSSCISASFYPHINSQRSLAEWLAEVRNSASSPGNPNATAWCSCSKHQACNYVLCGFLPDSSPQTLRHTGGLLKRLIK